MLKSSPQKLAYMRAYSARNRERHRAEYKKYIRTRRGQLARRKSQIKTRYGLDWEAYQLMLRGQGYRCAICEKKRKLGVDHCHKTGRIRGLLCNRCNVAIGYLKNNPRIAARACKYLRSK